MAVALARVNRADVWYELAGSGPPLVLLHAGGTDARMWDEQYPRLAEQFSVLASTRAAMANLQSALTRKRPSIYSPPMRSMSSMRAESRALIFAACP